MLTRKLPFLMLLSMLLLVILPVSAQDTSKTLTIGFAPVGSESTWRVEFISATKAEAQKRGINPLFVDRQNSQDTQIAALRSFVTQKVDAIILAPVVETRWAQVLKEVKDAGIPGSGERIGDELNSEG